MDIHIPPDNQIQIEFPTTPPNQQIIVKEPPNIKEAHRKSKMAKRLFFNG